MTISEDGISVRRFITAIEQLPSDPPVEDRVQGYNKYNTQKEHWLGWLGDYHQTGAYGRDTGTNRDARFVYNHIVEPKMLLWLIAAARVKPSSIGSATRASSRADTLQGKSASIRRHVPWSEVAVALWGAQADDARWA